jgi:NifU-like protein involved in Fe-S cluster formation
MRLQLELRITDADNTKPVVSPRVYALMVNDATVADAGTLSRAARDDVIRQMVHEGVMHAWRIHSADIMNDIVAYIETKKEP